MRQAGHVTDPDQAADRLAELGLKPEVLGLALAGADAEARTYTELDPPNMAGMARYSRTVRLLREQLVPLGWGHDNPRNLARTTSPDHRIAIITTLGDEATGEPAAVPSTRYGKGVATEEAVNRNFIQLALFDPEDGEAVDADPEGIATWVLLYHVTDTEIRSELSLPDSMVDGYIDTWLERIILPPVPLEPAPEAGAPRPAADPDVVVTRRTA